MQSEQPVEIVGGRGGPLKGEVVVPGDKSISHRAIILGSIAEGTTLVKNFLPSQDCLSTLCAMRMMGVEIEHAEGGVEAVVRGRGLYGLTEPEEVIDAGNSGTTARLLTGLLSAQSFFSVLTGDQYLRRRPMGRVVAPLREMGASIWGRRNGERLPLAIKGSRLRGIRYSPPQASAQVKTALLLAGIYADGETAVDEPIPTRDHTERMMRHLGVDITMEGTSIVVRGGSSFRGGEILVPGDISSASFFIVAALINPGSEVVIRDVGVNPLRIGVIDILRDMGGRIDIVNEREVCGEPVADVVARSSPLRGVDVGGALIPRAIDELPVVAVAACFAEGITVIEDAGELRVKETDRISAMTSELRRLGADVVETDDGMIIRGGKPLRGAYCSSWGDHRVAMAVAVAATAADGETTIENASVVSISFPGFFRKLSELR